jgi:hypothetical protein
MNHTELCDLTRPPGAVGRYAYVPTGSPKLDQGPKRAGPSTSTGSTNRFVAKPGDDPGDDFPIAMSADEHMSTGPPIADRNHQLLGMPEGQNNVAPLPI